MDLLREYLVLAIPVALVQLGLQVWAIVDLARRPRVKGGNKIPWVLLILLGGILGPVLYFFLGPREETEKEEGEGES